MEAGYRSCDLCGRKVFYDANLNYEFEGSVKYAGITVEGHSLDYLGDWAVLCDICAKTHKTQIVPINKV